MLAFGILRIESPASVFHLCRLKKTGESFEKKKLQLLDFITEGGNSKITLIIFSSCLVNSLVQISEFWILSFTMQTFAIVGLRFVCSVR